MAWGRHKPIEDARLTALDRAMATIELTVDGTIVGVNANFQALVGYPPQELIGKHHSLLVASGVSASDAYREFWHQLRAASTRSASSSGSARAARRSGSAPPTFRCSGPTGSRRA
jgi:methyl-accepting chemotaxis protein